MTSPDLPAARETQTGISSKSVSRPECPLDDQEGAAAPPRIASLRQHIGRDYACSEAERSSAPAGAGEKG